MFWQYWMDGNGHGGPLLQLPFAHRPVIGWLPALCWGVKHVNTMYACKGNFLSFFFSLSYWNWRINIEYSFIIPGNQRQPNWCVRIDRCISPLKRVSRLRPVNENDWMHTQLPSAECAIVRIHLPRCTSPPCVRELFTFFFCCCFRSPHKWWALQNRKEPYYIYKFDLLQHHRNGFLS